MNHAHHLCHAAMDTPLGPLLMARSAHGLSGVWFEGQKYHPGTLAAPRNDQDPLLAGTVAALGAYFEGRPFTLPVLAPQGTPFQQAVWQLLLRIPAGSTWTYGQLAARLGRPAAVRAVAAAVGRNPLSVLVPCHRVLGADGQLTGYAGGLDRKRALLALEAASPFPAGGDILGPVDDPSRKPPTMRPTPQGASA